MSFVSHRFLSRRRFLAAAAVCVAAPATVRGARAGESRAFVPGVQLYSVAAPLKRDFAGTLAKLAAMGYRQVELTDLHGKSAADWKKALDDAGLAAISIHHSVSTLEKDLTAALTFANTLGVSYIVCAAPRAAKAAQPTIDEWRWNADFLNKVGEECATATIRFGYHNHNTEFFAHKVSPMRNATGFSEIMTRTNPDYVTWELDCGWAVTAGLDPSALLMRYRNRFSLLHVKDVAKDGERNYELKIKAVPVGQGVLDWRTVFEAARRSGVQDYFVELEPGDGDPLVALKQSADFLKTVS